MSFSCRGCPKHPGGNGDHRESTHKRSLLEAQNELDRARGYTADGRPYMQVTDIMMSELLQGVVEEAEIHSKRATALEYSDKVRVHLMPFFGQHRALDLCYNESIVRGFIAQKTKDGYMPATINGMLTLLIRAFSLARNRIALMPKIKKLKVNNARKGFFTEAECLTLCKHLPEDIARPIRVMYITGWRSWSEVFSRERRHVDWKVGKLILEAGEAKNSEPRIFPLLPGGELRSILEEQEKETMAFERRSGTKVIALFHHEGSPIAKYYENRACWKPTRYFLTNWSAACKAAKLTGRFRHDFRRSAIRVFGEKGISDATGMELAGQKTARIYSAYKAITEADLFREVKKLESQSSSHAAKVDQHK